MSWDVFIQHLPASALRFADIPDDYTPLPLGTRAEVIAAVTEIFPGTDVTDPTWLTYRGDRCSIDFGLGVDDPVMTIALHTLGDESVVPLVERLIERLGARALDGWTGEFFDAATAVESIQRLRNYVDEQK